MIAFTSVKLFPPKRLVIQELKKECLAIKWVLESFRYYPLQGQEFVSQAKQMSTIEGKRLNSYFRRWYLPCSHIPFTIFH